MPRVFVVVGRMVINTYILILRIPDVRCLLAYNIIYPYIGGRVIVLDMSCCCLFCFVLFVVVCCFSNRLMFEVW